MSSRQYPRQNRSMASWAPLLPSRRIRDDASLGTMRRERPRPRSPSSSGSPRFATPPTSSRRSPTMASSRSTSAAPRPPSLASGEPPRRDGARPLPGWRGRARRPPLPHPRRPRAAADDGSRRRRRRTLLPRVRNSRPTTGGGP